MNDPYNGNGRKSPEDDLGRSIEKEVKETIGTVAAALQDAAREVSTSLRDNESVQRTVKDLGAAKGNVRIASNDLVAALDAVISGV